MFLYSVLSYENINPLEILSEIALQPFISVRKQLNKSPTSPHPEKPQKAALDTYIITV